MTQYKLIRLVSGSYDVVRNGAIVASLVRSGPSHEATWTAELLADLPHSIRPPPFTELEHRFASLEEARAWLDTPDIEGEG